MAYPRRPDRRGYDTAQVCLNGHLINAYTLTRPDHSERFCAKCGAETITQCQECKTPIRGYYHVPRVYGPSPKNPPAFCHECGKPYPWTEKRIEAARELADESVELDSGEKESLKATFSDLLRDTPKTPLAAQRFQKLWAKMKGPTAGAMRDILVQIASETATKLMFPSGK
ncbi:MAG: DUF2321 domain-containing protein [Candidatus Acidiferrales bacterium]